jgi:hypothetical protein
MVIKISLNHLNLLEIPLKNNDYPFLINGFTVECLVGHTQLCEVIFTIFKTLK